MLRMIRKKNKLFKKFCLSQLRSDEKKFKKIRNRVINVLRKARQEYYKNVFLLNRNSIRKTWKTINELLGKRKKQIPTTFESEGTFVTEPTEIANKFNDYFINIGISVSDSVPQSINSSHFYCQSNVVNSFFLSPVLVSELISVSKSLRSNACCGIDDVSCKVIKRTIHAIALPLVHIFNLSFISGKVPSKLKNLW